MLDNPFSWLMLTTFLAALLALGAGVIGMGTRHQQGQHNRSTFWMGLRVGLCALLLVEMIIYAFYLS